ncbi:hypothetical protein [Zavarzinella formosa]|uniref:hypothetical protein n=1 Tax=Zavarzinella formosa TaxID=360055 RepID=UPI0002E37989|nr:hypothetical protein [Zavarzinella formosa]
MGRVAITTCLILSILFGPMACCCSANISAAKPNTQTLSCNSAAIKHRKSCCETPTPTEEKPGKSGNKPVCPCKQNPSDKQAVVSAASGVNNPPVKVRLANAITDLIGRQSAISWHSGRRMTVDSPGACFARTGRDILTAHRKLTC